jgi:RNA polymerase sigma factor for flagellar operon FliA
MGDTTQLESLFLENLSLIDRITAVLARRNGLVGDDAEDFASWIKLRIVEDDYAILRKFRGESAIGTYLTVVIAMLARDYRVQRFGRWRPSAAARRVGRFAVRLEMLVHRQGYRLDQAGELLRTSGETELSDRELADLLARLPRRAPLRPVEVGAESLATIEAREDVEGVIAAGEHEQERRRIWDLLRETILGFETEDRLILRMRFWDEMSIAEVARALSLDQKPLYRRVDRLLVDLRRRLLAAGVTADEWTHLVSEVEP